MPSTETLGRVDLTQEDEGLPQEGAHPRNVEGLQEEGLQWEQRQGMAGVGNQAGENRGAQQRLSK